MYRAIKTTGTLIVIMCYYHLDSDENKRKNKTMENPESNANYILALTHYGCHHGAQPPPNSESTMLDDSFIHTDV
jgi:hypothetical protein